MGGKVVEGDKILSDVVREIRVQEGEIGEGYLERLDLPEFKHDIVLPKIEVGTIPEIYVDGAARRRLYVEVLTRKIGPAEFAQLVEEWVEKAIAQRSEKKDSWRGVSELVKLVLAYTAGEPAKVVQKEEGSGYEKLMGLLGEAEAEERAKEYAPSVKALGVEASAARERKRAMAEGEAKFVERVGDEEMAKAWALYEEWKRDEGLRGKMAEASEMVDGMVGDE